MESNMKIVIGTRGSKLALVQAEGVRTRLQHAYPKDEFILKIIQTKGDRITNLPLDQIGDKGLFVREIEAQLLAGDIQMAVHSMKDMPAELPEGLCFARAWSREDPRDVLVLRNVTCLKELPHHAVIATGSKRRAFQLQKLRPDLQIVGIRGNVDTRLRKMEQEQLDGIVLAAAGLHRLGRQELITQYLDPTEMIPAVAQGTLGLEVCRENRAVLGRLDALADEENAKVTEAERAFLQGIGGDCHMPIGAYGQMTDDGQIRLQAIFGNEDGSYLDRCSVQGTNPRQVAAEAVQHFTR
jgi:hydroxymethylbilane synthase